MMHRTIRLPDQPRGRRIPTTTTHAKRFVVGVLVSVLVGTVLLMLPWSAESRETTSPIDAMFTAVSATAVTGLTTLDTLHHWSVFGEVVILVLVQIGGFGFMAGASIALLSLRRGASLSDSLLMQDGSPAMTLNEVTSLTQRIIVYMLSCEAVGALALFLDYRTRMSLDTAAWHSIFHSVTALCNAGFDLNGDFRSVAGDTRHPIVLITLAILTQLGALSYMVVHEVWKKRSWNGLSLDAKLVLLLHTILVALGTIAFLVIEWSGSLAGIASGWKPANALFQSIVARTSGFATIDWSHAHASTLFIWAALMMVGGAAGSTAGGIKLATLGVIALVITSTVRGQTEPQAFGRRISTATVYRAVTMIGLFITAVFIVTTLLVLSEDWIGSHDWTLVSLLFESMSALSTVGLTTGVTPLLSDGGKLILCGAMFLGRLGPITAALALQNTQQPAHYRYPEAPIRIG